MIILAFEAICIKYKKQTNKYKEICNFTVNRETRVISTPADIRD